jgi:hypothetical protein
MGVLLLRLIANYVLSEDFNFGLLSQFGLCEIFFFGLGLTGNPGGLFFPSIYNSFGCSCSWLHSRGTFSFSVRHNYF